MLGGMKKLPKAALAAVTSLALITGATAPAHADTVSGINVGGTLHLGSVDIPAGSSVQAPTPVGIAAGVGVALAIVGVIALWAHQARTLGA